MLAAAAAAAVVVVVVLVLTLAVLVYGALAATSAAPGATGLTNA